MHDALISTQPIPLSPTVHDVLNAKHNACVIFESVLSAHLKSLHINGSADTS